MPACNFIDFIFPLPKLFDFFLLFPLEVIQGIRIFFQLRDRLIGFFCIIPRDRTSRKRAI